MTQERQPVIAGLILPANAGCDRAAVRAGCKGQHPFPRALWGGSSSADALGAPDGAGGELHAAQRGTDSPRHVRFERGGTSPAS